MSNATTNSPMKQFAVTVRDIRYIRHVVEADTAEEAYEEVQSSEDAMAEFGGTTIESHWCIESVEEA